MFSLFQSASEMTLRHGHLPRTPSPSILSFFQYANSSVLTGDKTVVSQGSVSEHIFRKQLKFLCFFEKQPHG